MTEVIKTVYILILTMMEQNYLLYQEMQLLADKDKLFDMI